MSGMKAREAALQARREALLGRSQVQRAVLGDHMASFLPALQAADSIAQIGRKIGRRGLWVGLGLITVLIIKRPSKLLSYSARAWGIWRGIQSLRQSPHN